MTGLLVALALGVPPTHAAQPLTPAGELAAATVEVWWRRGDLLLVTEGPDGREARRPLANEAVHPAPASLQGWKRIGESCENRSQTTFTLLDRPAIATVGGDASIPAVTIHREGLLVAHAPLGQPAQPCTITVVEADALPGLEVIVTWGLGDIHGVSVFRLPELAQ